MSPTAAEAQKFYKEINLIKTLEDAAANRGRRLPLHWI